MREQDPAASTRTGSVEEPDQLLLNQLGDSLITKNAPLWRTVAWPVTGVAQERLTRLELAGLSLTSAEWLATMRCLESVDLSDNQLSDLPDVCASAAGLRHLNLSRNLLRRLPHWILQLERVERLALEHNPLERAAALQLRSARWNNVIVCHLGSSNCSAVPDALCRGRHLRQLAFGNSHAPDRSIATVASAFGGGTAWPIAL